MESKRAWGASSRARIRLNLSVFWFCSLSCLSLFFILLLKVLLMLSLICLGDLYWWSGYPCVVLSSGPYGVDPFLRSFSVFSFQGPFITMLLECSPSSLIFLRQTQTNSSQFYIRLNPEVSPHKQSFTGMSTFVQGLDSTCQVPFIIVAYNTFVALYLSNLKTTSSRLSFSPTTCLSFPQILPLPAISNTSSGFKVTSEVGVRMLSKSLRSKGHMKADR